MPSQLIKKESEEIIEFSGYQPRPDSRGTPDQVIKSEYKDLIDFHRCPSTCHSEARLPETDSIQRARSRKKSNSAPPNLEPNIIASRNLRKLTEYKWRRQQVINGVGYPGRKNRGKPQIGKLWWGFAKQDDGTYTMERGHINGTLLFQYFTLVHPQSPPEGRGFVAADLGDIRELHVWDEIKNPVQHLRLSPAVGMLSQGFYQSPYEPDVLHVGYGPVVDIRRDYLFCFVVAPSGGGGAYLGYGEAEDGCVVGILQGRLLGYVTFRSWVSFVGYGIWMVYWVRKASSWSSSEYIRVYIHVH